MVDANGEIANHYAYKPFGEVVESSQSVINPFEFVGELGVKSDPSGTSNMRNRFYAASWGRFLSQDTIGLLAGDVNFYRYSQNAPAAIVDPTGLQGGPRINYNSIPLFSQPLAPLQLDSQLTFSKGQSIQVDTGDSIDEYTFEDNQRRAREGADLKGLLLMKKCIGRHICPGQCV